MIRFSFSHIIKVDAKKKKRVIAHNLSAKKIFSNLSFATCN